MKPDNHSLAVLWSSHKADVRNRILDISLASPRAVTKFNLIEIPSVPFLWNNGNLYNRWRP